MEERGAKRDPKPDGMGIGADCGGLFLSIVPENFCPAAGLRNLLPSSLGFTDRCSYCLCRNAVTAGGQRAGSGRDHRRQGQDDTISEKAQILGAAGGVSGTGCSGGAVRQSGIQKHLHFQGGKRLSYSPGGGGNL